MVASATAAYVWEDPGDSIMVQITLDVVERLGEAVELNLGTGARGVEIGGILLGHALQGSGRIVQIDDFELVPCQHLRGASYTLAPRDRDGLSAQLARRHIGQVVGFFRSHTRPGLYLDQDDFTIISHYFSDPSQVFLVVRPAADTPAVGGFFFWEEGDINRRAPYRQFPFNRDQLVAGDFSIADRLAVVPAIPPSLERTSRLSAVRFPAPHFPWVAVPVIAGVVLLAGLFVSLKNTPKAAPATTPLPGQSGPPLRLEAERVDDTLELHWDPNAAAMRKADLGVLWITDGDQRVRRELTQQELAAGSTSYTPTSATVNFELQVLTLSDHTNKSVEWAGAPSPADGTLAQNVPSPEPAQSSPIEPHTAVTQPPVGPVDPAAAKLRAKRQTPRREMTPVAAPVESARLAPVDVPPPPALAAPSEKSPQKLVAVLPPRAVSLPKVPEPEVTLEPVHGSAIKRVLHKISSLGENEEVDGVVLPSPIHKVSPAIPPNSEPGESFVDVKVSIDDTGNVSRAQLLSKKNDLAWASLNAARQWRFKPARKHDKAVASEIVLHFRFGG
jgi:protein TonB